ncbi:MAG: hypothetical protein P1U42_10940 [Phycisphaerales bacterium]|nr:hypothetical protein [Phycisphaerales bacterium]
MSVGRTENSINPMHLVTPDRVIVPTSTDRQVVPNQKPFDAPVGQIPFHRMLRAENLEPQKRVEQSNQIEASRNSDRFEPSNGVGLLPKLGEVLAVQTVERAPVQINESRQIQQPATGRLLDLYL